MLFQEGWNMPKRRIVLANESRLLREMLKRIIDKSENLKLVSEITNPQDLLSRIDHAYPEWSLSHIHLKIAFRTGWTAIWQTIPLNDFWHSPRMEVKSK
jgi:hypothetical protein